MKHENDLLNLAVKLGSTQVKTQVKNRNLLVSVSRTENRGNCSTHCGLMNNAWFVYNSNVHVSGFALTFSFHTDCCECRSDKCVINTRTRSELSSSFHSVSVRAAAYCSVNEPPANGGVINRTRLRPGSKLFYYCNRGYRLVGSSNATCRLHPNGLFQWDTPPPLCQGEHKSICVCVFVHTYIFPRTYTDLF